MNTMFSEEVLDKRQSTITKIGLSSADNISRADLNSLGASEDKSSAIAENFLAERDIEIDSLKRKNDTEIQSLATQYVCLVNRLKQQLAEKGKEIRRLDGQRHFMAIANQEKEKQLTQKDAEIKELNRCFDELQDVLIRTDNELKKERAEKQEQVRKLKEKINGPWGHLIDDADVDEIFPDVSNKKCGGSAAMPDISAGIKAGAEPAPRPSDKKQEVSKDGEAKDEISYGEDGEFHYPELKEGKE